MMTVGDRPGAGMEDLSGADRRLLDLVQVEFPAVPRPYAALARRLGLDDTGGETEAHARLSRLRASGVVRRLGGVFDSRALGFATTLVAARVPDDRLEEVAAAAGAYPEVTHNYSREGPLNLWFTLVARDTGRIRRILGKLRRATGVQFFDLPAERVFKTQVTFRFGEGGEGEPPGLGPLPQAGQVEERAPTAPGAAIPDPVDRSLIRILQGDLPTGPRPFLEVAGRLGLPHGEVLARIATYRRRGWLRRLAAVVAHRRAGFVANAMVAWEVAATLIDEAGRALARADGATHCYARPPAPDWPYRLYAMVHGSSRDECLAAVERIARAAGAPSYQVLFSTKEFKKTSPRYF